MTLGRALRHAPQRRQSVAFPYNSNSSSSILADDFDDDADADHNVGGGVNTQERSKASYWS